jgi:LysR family hydrogen peroxide-inducible transcriptional activator
MMNLPSLRHLRHLMALHDHGHFGRAAEACHVTQSTLSASIKELEGVLEATLVDRSKRRVVLTPVGVETVERARRIVKEVEDLVSFTTASREPLSGTVRMGTIPTVGPFLLPRVLPGLRESYNRLKLYLVEDLTHRLIDLLQRGQLDVVLLALPYDCGVVETVILFEDPFVVGLPREHPARQGDAREGRALVARGLVTAEGWPLPARSRACSLPSRRPARHRGLRGDEPSDPGADGRQRSRHHLVAYARGQCRLASGHRPGHPTIAQP